MKKKDYIEKYGEEAWEKRLEKNRIVLRKYYNEHKEKIQEANKKYYEANKEQIMLQCKEYFEKHKDKLLKYHREYLNNYSKTKKGRAIKLASNYRRDDRHKVGDDLETIDQYFIMNNILNSVCIYCGESDWRKLGCDRIDNTKAHTPDNVVCACMHCNAQRAKKYTVEEFKLKKQQELNSCAKVLPPAAS